MVHYLRSIYLVTYRDKDGEEISEEIPAYSDAQAELLASCDPSEIISIECTVRKRVAAGVR